MTKTWAMVLGWILVLIGVIGFFSNSIAGANGYFHADMMYSIINIILGAILLWASYSARTKVAATAKWIGIILIIVAILGFILVGNSTGSLLGIAEINGADSWLNLVVGILLLFAGMKGKGGHMQM